MIELNNRKVNQGFTLVELAIVIVIIGLLVGGVLQGQELINQAKIRSQIKQFEEFNAASLLFKSKYGNIPGDLTPTARVAFGLTGTSSTNAGNGIINDQYGYIPNVSAWNESYFFFSNLSEVKLIKDYLRQISNNFSVSVVFPAAKIGDGGIAAVQMTDGIYWFLGPTLKNDPVGTELFSGNSPTPSIDPQSAFAIDTKLDDGVPSTGIVRAIVVSSSAPNFANDTTTGASACLSSTTAYNLTTSTPLCRLIIKSMVN